MKTSKPKTPANRKSPARKRTSKALATKMASRPPAAQTALPSKPPNPEPRVMPSLSYLPTPSNTPFQSAISSPCPSEKELEAATSLFLTAPSSKSCKRFLYSAPRFLHIPINTRVPEICILGRSNVGKSTLLNALAGASAAGSAHGPTATRAGLALTSSKAGCTRTMNAYGFGPPLPCHSQTDKAPKSAAKGMATRSARRRARQKTAEPPARCSLVVMDMPGYGLHSRAEWGVEISKYLRGRTMLCGAVLLVDAVAGVKDGDRAALQMLRNAGVRTTVVLTKADKVLVRSRTEKTEKEKAGRAERAEKGDDRLREQCAEVWRELRDVEAGGWVEGSGWRPEIYVTGAGDPKLGGLGVAGARLALCRLARVMPEEDSADSAAVVATAAKFVSFDQLDQMQWVEPSKPVKVQQDLEQRYVEQRIAELQNVEQRSPARAGRTRRTVASPRRRMIWAGAMPSQESPQVDAHVQA